MGLHDITNINFFSLAISDLVSALSLVLIMITNNTDIELPSGASIDEITHVTSFILYANSAIAGFITTILSMERCLCIVAPLTVKKVVTGKRIVVLTSIFVAYEMVFVGLLIGKTGPPYVGKSPYRALYLLCSYSVISLICFVIISVSTVFLIIRLKQSLSWRKKTSTAPAGQATSNKEAKATRCVIFICMLFILSFFPNLFVIIFASVYPTFSLWNPYFTRLAYILCYVSFMSQAISVSTNVIVYYTSSSRYRQIFRSLFPCFKEEK
ncbi:chemosensory receptor a [Plakobranchus ocellatus]|uniref:Chemosensory receptor a n=1 Tax=Plakobranchus ocellatus TaxID=259542 RepID=A0AAV4ARC9_9GAST|nr:chemosensory receptor a [Plakobranchus ocellatus]